MSALHVLIAGGGLSGLCLAHGLRERGHTCEVFERDPAYTRRSGYMLNINGDGGEALRACLPADLFELYRQTSHRTPGRRGTVVVDDQLRELSTMAHLGPDNAGPLPHTAVDRQTLRTILSARLDEVVRAAVAALDYTEDAAGVRLALEDGTEATGDVLVGADGIRSAIRRRRLPDVKVIEAGIEGIGVYGRSPLPDQLVDRLPRVLLENIAMAGDRAGHRLLLGPMRPRRPLPEAAAALAPDVVLAPLAAYTMVSCSVSPDTPVPPAARWTARTPLILRDAMLRALEGWDPTLRGIVERIEPDSMFEISFGLLDPPPPWEASRVTLIGDAAHAMLPTLGMGANLALRDARLMAEHLDGAGPRRDRLVGAIGAGEEAMRDYAYPLMEMTLKAERFGGGGLAQLS